MLPTRKFRAKKIKEMQKKEAKLIQQSIVRGAAKNKQSGAVNGSICTSCSGSEKIAQTAEAIAYPYGTKKVNINIHIVKHILLVGSS